MSFLCVIPSEVVAGQVLEVPVPQGFAQSGQMAQFMVPEGAFPGMQVQVPLPQVQQDDSAPHSALGGPAVMQGAHDTNAEHQVLRTRVVIT